MKITPLEIEEYRLNNNLFGYDKSEVDVLRALAADALSSARSEVADLSDKLGRAETSLVEHEDRESVLKATITTAQKMSEDMKKNTMKENEFIIAEARHQAEEITKQAMQRAAEIQDEITTLKKQRIEMETSIRAILKYHSTVLQMEEADSKRADKEANKLKYMAKPAVNDENS